LVAVFLQLGVELDAGVVLVVAVDAFEWGLTEDSCRGPEYCAYPLIVQSAEASKGRFAAGIDHIEIVENKIGVAADIHTAVVVLAAAAAAAVLAYSLGGKMDSSVVKEHFVLPHDNSQVDIVVVEIVLLDFETRIGSSEIVA